jgi:hypothetical protein
MEKASTRTIPWHVRAADCTAFTIPIMDIGLGAGWNAQRKRLSHYFVRHKHTDRDHFLDTPNVEKQVP